jgi:hypothetical protein
MMQISREHERVRHRRPYHSSHADFLLLAGVGLIVGVAVGIAVDAIGLGIALGVGIGWVVGAVPWLTCDVAAAKRAHAHHAA